MRCLLVHGPIVAIVVMHALVGIPWLTFCLAESPQSNAETGYFLGPDARGRELKDGCDLSGLDLRGMVLYGTDHKYSGINFDVSDLSGANLEGEDSSSTEFRNCTFRKAILRRVEADWVLDPSCDLTDADIHGSRIKLDAKQLRSTWNYKKKDLSHTSIRLVGIQPGFSFAGFNLQGTSLVGVQTQTLFQGADFDDADIRGADMRLTATQLRSTRNYKAGDLADTTLVGSFAGVSFRGFNLRNTAFEVCDLTGCDFADAEISGMLVYGGGIYDDKGESTGSDCPYSRFTKEQLYSTSSYQRRSLDSVHFYHCDFRNADFSNQSLGFFFDCNVEGADFTNADHLGKLDSGCTRYRHLPVNFGFGRCNLVAKQFHSTRIYRSRRLQPGCSLTDLDLKKWDFSNFDLRSVDFAFSDLTEAKLDNARGGRFRFAEGLTLAQVKSMWNYKSKRMNLGSEFTLACEIVEQLEKETRTEEK